MDIKCDIPNCNCKAIVDSKTTLGPWAYLCKDHFRKIGIYKAGLFFPLITDFDSELNYTSQEIINSTT